MDNDEGDEHNCTEVEEDDVGEDESVYIDGTAFDKDVQDDLVSNVMVACLINAEPFGEGFSDIGPAS